MDLLNTKVAISGPASASRALPSWIDAFVEYTDPFGSPRLFQKWAGIAALAGCLERRFWTTTSRGTLFPTLYTILVGPPGIGKTMLTATVQDIWSELPDAHLAPSSVTKAALVDALADARRSYLPLGGQLYEYNTLLVVANELGVLIPEYETGFMSTLTDIYDGKPYGERRRTRDVKLNIKAPQIQLLAGTTPGHLRASLPEGAWDQGFMSRALMIFSEDNIITDPFAQHVANQTLLAKLIADAKQMMAGFGEMAFEGEAKALLRDWHMAGGPPAPEHPKLRHYNSRRTTHLMKLAMIAAVSENHSTITEPDVGLALSWLLEAETYMPDVFKSMRGGGDSQAIEEAWFYCLQIHAKEKRPIAHYRLITFVQERVPAHSVERVIDLMVKGNVLKPQLDNNGQPAYVPQPRSPR